MASQWNRFGVPRKLIVPVSMEASVMRIAARALRGKKDVNHNPAVNELVNFLYLETGKGGKGGCIYPKRARPLNAGSVSCV